MNGLCAFPPQVIIFTTKQCILDDVNEMGKRQTEGILDTAVSV